MSYLYLVTGKENVRQAVKQDVRNGHLRESMLASHV
jgi:hypothetical protein